MNIFWGLAGVCQPPSTFWSVTLQPMGTDQASIYHLKWDIPSFHMRYRGLISIHRLHRKINFGPLSFFPLVFAVLGIVKHVKHVKQISLTKEIN